MALARRSWTAQDLLVLGSLLLALAGQTLYFGVRMGRVEAQLEVVLHRLGLGP